MGFKVTLFSSFFPVIFHGGKGEISFAAILKQQLVLSYAIFLSRLMIAAFIS